MSDKTSNQLEISVEYDGGAATMVVAGEVDLDSSTALAEALAGALASARSAPEVSLDLRGVRYMDSTGLRAILEAQHNAERAGGRLTVMATSNIVRRLIEISGVAELLGLPPTE